MKKVKDKKVKDNSNEKAKINNKAKAGSNKAKINLRSLKYGSNSLVLIAIVVSAVLLVNIIIGLFDIRFDLTSSKLYSIGEVTKEILENLDKDVEIIGLFDGGKPPYKDYMDVMELLKQYEKYDHIKVRTIDPDKNPGFIGDLDKDNQKNIQKNDFVVKCGNKIKRLTYTDLVAIDYNEYFQAQKVGSLAEQSITGAIRFVSSDKTPTIYFTQGHQEYSPDENLKLVRSQLERNNFDVKTINLITEARVPDDAAALVVVSPKQDLLTVEKRKIQDFLDNGGDAIFMFDSLEKGSEFKEFNDLFRPYNISINNDKVKETDPERHLPTDPYNVLVDISANEVIPQSFSTFFKDSRSINLLKNEKEYITITSLIKTSAKSVGEQIDKSAGNDIAGPLDLAVAIDNMGGFTSSKMIVIGNARFITDESAIELGDYFTNGMVFFLSALNWAIDREDVLMIPAKLNLVEKLSITQQQAKITMYLVVAVLPLFILGVGAFVWLRRRHL